MRLYAIFYESSVPVVLGKLFSHTGFQASTLGPFIFAPGEKGTLHPRVFIHEKRHVVHFYVIWALAIVAWLVVRPSPWWLLASPLAYLAVYVAVGIGGLFFDRSFYHDNLFERDARRHAGEPVD